MRHVGHGVPVVNRSSVTGVDFFPTVRKRTAGAGAGRGRTVGLLTVAALLTVALLLVSTTITALLTVTSTVATLLLVPAAVPALAVPAL